MFYPSKQTFLITYLNTQHILYTQYTHIRKYVKTDLGRSFSTLNVFYIFFNEPFQLLIIKSTWYTMIVNLSYKVLFCHYTIFKHVPSICFPAYTR